MKTAWRAGFSLAPPRRNSSPARTKKVRPPKTSSPECAYDQTPRVVEKQCSDRVGDRRQRHHGFLIGDARDALAKNSVGYLQSEGVGTVSLSQTLSATLQNDTTYTLSALIGRRTYTPRFNYAIQLWAGSTILLPVHHCVVQLLPPELGANAPASASARVADPVQFASVPPLDARAEFGRRLQNGPFTHVQRHSGGPRMTGFGL
jgi:hypothetical protein